MSFAEIFTVKAVEGFQSHGYGDGEAYAYATITFFSGVVFTYILDQIVHSLGKLDSSHEDRKSGLPAAEGGETRAAKLIGNFGACFGWLPSGAATASAQPQVDEPTPEVDEEKVTVTDVDASVPTQIAEPERVGSPGTADAAEAKPKALQKMGLMTGIAIALHNFPEGLATFVASLADEKLGIAIALAISMHNIPEGVCVAFPVYYATGSRWKGFMWSFLSGVSEPIGGLFGYLVLYGNALSDLAYGVLFAIVGGMMVYISLKELIPMALKYDPQDRVTMHCCFVGMAVMALSLVLFQV